MFASAVRDYVENFKVALAFAVLLAFFLPFSTLGASFVSSGTIFLDFNLFFSDLTILALEIATLSIFLLVYSFLTTMAVFAVKRDISKASIGRYLALGMPRYAFKYFFFALAFTLIATIVSSLAALFQLPLYFLSAAIFLISLPFLFLPQALVIDELRLRTAVSASTEFILRKPTALIYTFALGIVFAVALPLIELFFDATFQIGKFISLLVALVVAVPFFEFFKSELYMRRFELVKSSRSVTPSDRPVRNKLVIKDITLARHAQSRKMKSTKR